MGRPAKLSVRRDARLIVERLRTTDVTVKQLQREYDCCYCTLMTAVESVICHDEYMGIVQGRIEARQAEEIRKLRSGVVTWDCVGCAKSYASIPPKCGKCQGTAFERVETGRLELDDGGSVRESA